MDIIKSFALGTNKSFDINIRGTREAPMFAAADIGELLEMTNIRKVISNFDEDERCNINVPTASGIQKSTFLTAQGLYVLLIISRKPIAKPFRKWVCKVIDEIRTTGAYAPKEDQVDLAFAEHRAQDLLSNMLVKEYNMRNVVYVAVVKDFGDGTMIVKIGMSHDIAGRVMALKGNKMFGQCRLLKVFACNRHNELEQYALKHETMKPFKFYDIVFKNTETFKLTIDQVDKILVPVIEQKICELSGKEEIQLQLESARRELAEIKLAELAVISARLDAKTELAKHTTEDIKEIKLMDHTKAHIIKKRASSCGPIVQLYDPNTHDILKTYSTIIDANRELKTSSSGLKNSCNERTVMLGKFRVYLQYDRTLGDEKIDIGPNSDKFLVRAGAAVCAIHPNKTCIEMVYSCQKEAAEERVAKASSIANAIKREGLCQGFYWIHYDNAPEELRNAWEAEHGRPVSARELGKDRAGRSKHVEQIDPRDNNVVHIHESLSDVMEKFQMSYLTLHKVSKNNEVHRGYKWNVIGE